MARQPVGIAGALQHPLLGAADGLRAQAARPVPLPELQNLVGLQEEIAPAEESFVVRKTQRHARRRTVPSSVNPAGTGRCGFMACTIDSGITIARVHEDIS